VDFETCLGESREHGGHQRDPPLPGINFLRNTDDQESLPVPRPALTALRAG